LPAEAPGATVDNDMVHFAVGVSNCEHVQASSPSSLDGPQAAEEDKEAFVKSMPSYRG
jgi:hypothetical protein